MELYGDLRCLMNLSSSLVKHRPQRPTSFEEAGRLRPGELGTEVPQRVQGQSPMVGVWGGEAPRSRTLVAALESNFYIKSDTQSDKPSEN